MVYIWTFFFFTTMALTRFRNIFWTGIYFYYFVYILTFSFLTTADVASENTGYKTRLFETLGTLIFIIIIFLNAFNLYQLSNNKYENAYQNSIRDYLTQLYNRRYFYLVLIKKMQRVSVQNHCLNCYATSIISSASMTNMVTFREILLFSMWPGYFRIRFAEMILWPEQAARNLRYYCLTWANSRRNSSPSGPARPLSTQATSAAGLNCPKASRSVSVLPQRRILKRYRMNDLTVPTAPCTRQKKQVGIAWLPGRSPPALYSLDN